jgi:hypothetical protein
VKIIAFGHEQNVGKNTACVFLVTELRMRKKGINILVAAFADKVKSIAYDLFSWAGLQPGHFYEDHYDLKNQILPKIGKTPRELWIGVGNGLRAATIETVWAEYLFNQSSIDYLFINDLRFPVEAEYILNRGGKIYKIVRPGSGGIVDGADDKLTTWNGWSKIITNDGTLKDFYNKIIGLLDE